MSDLCQEARTLRDIDERVFWYHGSHGIAQVLHTAIPELQYFCRKSWAYIPKLGVFYGDEFLSGIYNHAFGKQKHLPFHLAAMTQCYRNIYDILGGNMNGSALANIERFQSSKAAVKSFDDFTFCRSENARFASTPLWKVYFDYVKSPTNPDAILAESLAADPSSVNKLVGSLMYSIANIPTIAAGMIFDSVCYMQGYGCAIAHINLPVHCAAHLYAACRFAGLVQDASVWRDMEFSWIATACSPTQSPPLIPSR